MRCIEECAVIMAGMCFRTVMFNECNIVRVSWIFGVCFMKYWLHVNGAGRFPSNHSWESWPFKSEVCSV